VFRLTGDNELIVDVTMRRKDGTSETKSLTFKKGKAHG